MRLILVRHPKPLCEPGLCYGRLDLECERAALEDAASRLKALAASRQVISSPARRALALAERLSSNVLVETRLQELHFGAWEGRRWSDLGKAPIDAWRRGLPDAAPPGGETLTSLAARCADWLAALAPAEQPTLAITHAGPIRAIRALVEGKPLLHYFGASVPYAQPIEIEVR